jgi:hypothetical protein
MIAFSRTYTLALALALLPATGAGLLLYLTGLIAAGGDVRTHVPAEVFPWLALTQVAYAVAIVIVLCARRINPPAGRRLSRAPNWALLPAVPGGTVVGLYGLWAERR